MRLAIASVALAALLLATPAGAASRAKCRLPSTATVVASSSFAVVYSLSGGPQLHRACIRGSGRRILVQSGSESAPDFPPEVRHMTLAGRYVGWVEIFGDRYGQSHVIARVHDLKKARRRWSGLGPFRPTGNPPEVTDFALGKHGRMAYVTREHRPEYPEREPEYRPGEWRTVWALDAGGSRKLEEGRDAIDLASLEIAGFTVSWASAGRPMSAGLY